MIKQDGYLVCINFKSNVGVKLESKKEFFNKYCGVAKMLWGKEGKNNSCAMFHLDHHGGYNSFFKNAIHLFGEGKLFEMTPRLIKKC